MRIILLGIFLVAISVFLGACAPKMLVPIPVPPTEEITGWVLVAKNPNLYRYYDPLMGGIICFRLASPNTNSEQLRCVK